MPGRASWISLLVAVAVWAVVAHGGAGPAPARGAAPRGLAEAVIQTLGPAGGRAVATAGPQLSQQQELQAGDGAPGDEFGARVTLSAAGDIALIGAPEKDGRTGAAY